MVPSSHLYAERESFPLDELSDETLVLFDRDSGYYGMILGLFRDLGVMPRQQMQLDSIEATKKMVEAGLGIALLPERSIDRELKVGTLHKVQVESAQPVRRDIAVMYRSAKPQSGHMSAFLELIAGAFKVDLPK